ncbi:GNAT family N-acetyltransferase [Streptomyces sp. HUAS TT7]|uniref:GNAT family N-acetyltransferase n=1 Tax=Streptomyces sp. HUAS TT7 TaxID=3447507 RepID=UPI003F65F020
MGFQWDWLLPYLAVPYVPTLGPIHPDALSAERFNDILNVADSGKFLPYDKDRRWSSTKAERVLVDDIEHTARQTLIPTVLRRGLGTVKVHVYGADPDALTTAADLAHKLCAVHNAQTPRIVWLLGPEQPDQYAQGTRVQLKDFAAGAGAAPAFLAQEYGQLSPASRTDFAGFAQRMAGDGFAFLYEQMQAGAVGPVLTVVHEGRVAGAIGPMETMTEFEGEGRIGVRGRENGYS